MGPLLFLLYINDIINVSTLWYIILFADDTSLFSHGKNIDLLINNLNTELVKLSQWLNSNKLTINVKKTNFIIFNTGRKKIEFTNKLSINEENINYVKSTKFRGVMLDHKLSWADHIAFIKNKIAKSIGIICKARKYLNEKSLLTLYYSFFLSLHHLCY